MADLILIQPQLAAAAVDRGENAGEMQLGAALESKKFGSNDSFSTLPHAVALGSLAVLLAVALSGCSEKPAPQAAAAAAAGHGRATGQTHRHGLG